MAGAHPLSGQKVKIVKRGKFRHAETVLKSGDPDRADVTVQWGGDWLLVSRDDEGDMHVVGFTPEQVRALIPILRSFDDKQK